MQSVTDSREHQRAQQCHAVKERQPLQPEVGRSQLPAAPLRFRLNNQRRAYETALDMASALGGGSKWGRRTPALPQTQTHVVKFKTWSKIADRDA